MPVIVAVTADRRAAGPRAAASGRVRPPHPEVYVAEAVVEAVRAAGGEPVLLPPREGAEPAWIEAILGFAHAVVLTGGAVDLHPSHYGQAVHGRLDRVDEGRAALELGLARAAMAGDVPILGVCGGMQTLAVAAGGSLIQDILSQLPGAREHEQPTDPATAWHPVRLAPGPLRDGWGRDEVQVNSTHHQSVAEPGALCVSGRAPDGVAEVVHHPTLRYCVGVQWHPEGLDPDEADPLLPYRLLVAAARR